jgi:hypothetical protein
LHTVASLRSRITSLLGSSVAKVYIKAEMLKQYYGVNNGLEKQAGHTIKRIVYFANKDYVLGSPFKKRGHKQTELKADIRIPYIFQFFGTQSCSGSSIERIYLQIIPVRSDIVWELD